MLTSASSWLKDREILHQNLSNGGLLVKLDADEVGKVFPKKGLLRGAFRILFRRTKAHKQYFSMRALQNIGIAVPEPLRVVSFNPMGKDFEGALVYKFVNEVVEAREAIGGNLRSVVLEGLADDLIKMSKASILLVDLHLGNILVDQAGRLIWIDVEVKHGSKVVRSRFWSRLQRMHQVCDSGVLTEVEWQDLCQRLAAALPDLDGQPCG